MSKFSVIYCTFTVLILSSCGGGGGTAVPASPVVEDINPINQTIAPTTMVNVTPNEVIIEFGDQRLEPMNVGSSITVAASQRPFSSFIYGSILSPSITEYDLKWSSSKGSIFAGDACKFSTGADCNRNNGGTEIGFPDPISHPDDYPLTVTLDAMQSDGKSLSSGSVVFTVEDKIPVAHIIAPVYDSTGSFVLGNTLELNGLFSYDPQWGSLTHYIWSLESIPAGSSASLNKAVSNRKNGVRGTCDEYT